MADSFTVTAEPLTADAFAPFGQLISEGDCAMELRDGEEFHLNVLHYERVPLVVDHLNRHHKATQALVALAGKPTLLVVAPAERDFSTSDHLDSVRAFICDGSAGVNLALGTWHWGPYPINDHVDLVNVQGRGFANDNEVAHLERDLGVVVRVVLERSNVRPMSDLFSIAGKTALVTGGSRGIGLMIARGFVEAGAKVYISSRKADVCDEVAAELSKVGECISLPADLSSEDECRRLADAVGAEEDRLHILVNNAGATWGAPLAEHDNASWGRVLAINVEAPFHLTKFCVPLLKAASEPDDPARVINIGSIDGIQVPMMETYSYSSSKAAVHQLTRHLARHLAPEITVNAVAPGPFESKMMAATLAAAGDAIAAGTPMKRIGRPDDMAGIAIFLASRAGAYLTGACIPVDGGISTCK